MSRARRQARKAVAETWAGYRQATFSQTTGTMVVVLRAADAGIDDDPDYPWATLCDDHDSVCLHRTLAVARDFAPTPDAWCQGCREVLYGGKAAS